MTGLALDQWCKKERRCNFKALLSLKTNVKMLQGKSKSLMEEADHKDIADAAWKFIEENADSHTAIQALHDKGEAALLEAIKKKNDNWLEQSGNKQGRVHQMHPRTQTRTPN